MGVPNAALSQVHTARGRAFHCNLFAINIRDKWNSVLAKRISASIPNAKAAVSLQTSL